MKDVNLYLKEIGKRKKKPFDYNHIRLPEMLLTYAEAVYELNGNIDNSSFRQDYQCNP